MSPSSSFTEVIQCHDRPLAHLLNAAKEKLQDITLGETCLSNYPSRIASTMGQSEVNALERDAFEVLRLIRSKKNSLAPINKVPPEVLSLIPDYRKFGKDRDWITLTHVCRAWRDIFISRSSLWTRLHLTNIDKTNTYIQRSQSSLLELCLSYRSVIDDAFALVVPHMGQVKSLTIDTRTLQKFPGHFRRHLPLLEMLEIKKSTYPINPVLDGSLFNGDFPSLRYLRLNGVFPHFPWKMANLRVVDLAHDSQKYEITQILDFFESAPLLNTIRLAYSPPESSEVPTGRLVHLRHLKAVDVVETSHPTLLRHLLIPIGALLTSHVVFYGEEPPLLDYLPERSPNFNNLSHITTINLSFRRSYKSMRFCGPSGSLDLILHWESISYIQDRKILHSLSHPMRSTTERLAISGYRHPGPAEVEECHVFRMLSFMNNIRTLVLVDCNDIPFILALDPEQNPSELILCPNMEKLIHHTGSHWSPLTIKYLIRMAKNRASRGVRLSSVTIVDLKSCRPTEEVLKLREHVAHVEHRADKFLPAWDDVPGVNFDRASRFGRCCC